MFRNFKTGFAVMGALALLGYGSCFGLGVCIGLMTWDLPPVFKPILEWQLFVLLALGCGVPFAAVMGFQRNRHPAILGCGLAATLWIWWLPMVRVSWPVRQQGLQQAAAKMSLSLVDEIESYRSRTGVYPSNLGFLGAAVETGMVSYSHLTYRRAEAQSPFAGYEIRVRTGFGMGFDSFFYWPSEKYPARIYGGSTEIIRAEGRNWAYVHE